MLIAVAGCHAQYFRCGGGLKEPLGGGEAALALLGWQGGVADIAQLGGGGQARRGLHHGSREDIAAVSERKAPGAGRATGEPQALSRAELVNPFKCSVPKW